MNLISRVKKKANPLCGSMDIFWDLIRQIQSKATEKVQLFGGNKLTSAEQTLTIRSPGSVYKGIHFGLKQENLMELLPLNGIPVPQQPHSPFHMNLNTCYSSVFFSTGCKCDFPFVHAGMTSLACFKPTLSAENGR